MQSDEPKRVRKILILTSNPPGTVVLRLGNEARCIKKLLKWSANRDQFHIQIEYGFTIETLREALLEYQPEIVHFCGHGEGADGIVYEGEDGQRRLILADALSDLFKLAKDHVKCVVLNACLSEIQANEIAKYIDFVVGMKDEVSDEAALKFAEGFFVALYAGEELVKCFYHGDNAIRAAGIHDSKPIMIRKGSVNKTENSPEEKQAAPCPHPNEPDGENPDPELSPSPPQPPFITRHPRLRQMPKREFLNILISVLSSVGFISLLSIGKRNEMAGNDVHASDQEQEKEKIVSTGTKQLEIAGYYIQVDEPNTDTPQDELGTRIYTSANNDIWGYAIRSTLIVFFNSQIGKTGKWQAIETTFMKYYYVTESDGIRKKYFVGSSKAEFKHTEDRTQNGKIYTTGLRSPGVCGLKGELLFGDQEWAGKIKDLVDTEARIIEVAFKESRSVWYQEDNGDLIKEEIYIGKGPRKKKNPERFGLLR